MKTGAYSNLHSAGKLETDGSLPDDLGVGLGDGFMLGLSPSSARAPNKPLCCCTMTDQVILFSLPI